MDFIPIIAASTAGLLYLNAKFSIGSDISQIKGLWRGQKQLQHLHQIRGEDDWSYYHAIHSNSHLIDQEALIFEGRIWTYKQLREEIGRCAEALRKLGVQNRTVVAMFIDNSPEFVFSWFALYKIGAIPAPVNTSITGDHIKHCLKISEAKFVITSFDLYPIFAKIQTDLIVYDYNTYPAIPISGTLLRQDDLPFESSMADFNSRPKIFPTDASQYLFTSGTTGLPKALIWPAIYAQAGLMQKRWPGMFDKPRRYYICLPMFHGTAVFGALAPTLSNGGTAIIARRFSRRQFWTDIRQSRANAIVYIGEMLRYLVQSPPDPKDKEHNVDLAFGLGLSPKIWEDFRERFGVPWIVEYYSASEATLSIMNSNKNGYGIGKVARWGPLMRRVQKSFYTVKTDMETGEILRNPAGFCIQTKSGEVGEAICRILPPLQRRHDYVGPEGEEATKKKVLRDVFEKGDEFFRLGDAMMIDSDGFVSFRDRLGDTFRAKGHNISTTEVESCFIRHPNIESVNVFAIPMNTYGYEGQLGCAAITLKDQSSEQTLVEILEQWLLKNESALPAYAVPRFLRILSSIEEGKEGHTTEIGAERVSTIMKKKKVELRKEGFTLRPGSQDRLYWIEREGTGYIPFRPEIAESIRSGTARL